MKPPRGSLAAALCAALGTLAPGGSIAPARGAEDPPCVLDKCLGQQPDGGAPASSGAPGGGFGSVAAPRRSATAPGNFDFYVLALSWSPGFCATGGESKARQQCASGSGLGFVVHGLWPQYRHGYPSDCGNYGRSPSRQALDSAEGVYPDRGLARYEWTKHGTCTGQSPTDYFADVRRAREAVAIPPGFAAPGGDQTWAPIDVARAFAAANPGLRVDEMAVTCRGGVFEEVRLCMSKDLRGYVPCPEVARGACRTRVMSVPGLR